MYVTTTIPINKKWTGLIYFVPMDPAKERFKVSRRAARSSIRKLTQITLDRARDAQKRDYQESQGRCRQVHERRPEKGELVLFFIAEVTLTILATAHLSRGVQD